MAVITLHINPGSDGDGRRRPKTNDYIRNDEYWLVRLGEAWAKHTGRHQPGHTYRLDRLPDGYGGYEKTRPGTTHVDRYVHGHAKGQARSVPDFLPHFLFLMGNGHAAGCTCKLCANGGNRSGSKRTSGVGRVADTESAGSGSPLQSQYFAKPKVSTSRPQSTAPQPRQLGRPRLGTQNMTRDSDDSDAPPPPRRKQVDEEGTPDALRALLDKLKAANENAEPEERVVDERIVESMSPDWRAGHSALMKELKTAAKLPGCVPRKGDLVLFVRNLAANEVLGWDKSAQAWRVLDLQTRSWAHRPKWEAGVVTQTPKEPLTDDDLDGIPASKKSNVINSGFRIEPLPQPNSVKKSYTTQHKYIPLHATRPLAMWRECLHGVSEEDWHPTISHALTVISSFCVLGRYHFKGTWPEATIFAQGIFIGPELITVGDTVRLHNRSGEHADDAVTDVMVITAIKVRIVNLDEASDDDHDDGHPYNTCTHISGHTYTQDPTRSFDGVGKLPISSESVLLPKGLRELGTWYHVTDPKNTKARIEVPFTRVIGRCYESAALEAWFTPPTTIAAPPSSFQAVNAIKPSIAVNDQAISTDLSRGLPGLLQARAFSQKSDVRIDRNNGKTWFWADTRVEQLDLHEVNGHYVGMRNTEHRSREKLADWRKALKAMDGRRGGVEEYHAARKEREQAQAKRKNAMGASGSGMVAGAAHAAAAGPMQSATEAERTSADDDDDGGEEEEDVMEVDEIKVTRAPPALVSDMDVDEEDEEDEAEAGNVLAAFKAKPGAARGADEVIMLD